MLNSGLPTIKSYTRMDGIAEWQGVPPLQKMDGGTLRHLMSETRRVAKLAHLLGESDEHHSVVPAARERLRSTMHAAEFDLPEGRPVRAHLYTLTEKGAEVLTALYGPSLNDPTFLQAEIEEFRRLNPNLKHSSVHQVLAIANPDLVEFLRDKAAAILKTVPQWDKHRVDQSLLLDFANHIVCEMFKDELDLASFRAWADSKMFVGQGSRRFLAGARPADCQAETSEYGRYLGTPGLMTSGPISCGHRFEKSNDGSFHASWVTPG